MKLYVAQCLAILTLGICMAGAQAGSPAPRTNNDPVVLRFSTVGDSRQDPEGFDPTQGPLSRQDAIWLQNTRAWSRILREVSAQKSQLLFFNGDMIMGYGKAGPTPGSAVDEVLGSDLMAFYRQYSFWRGMVATLMEAGTYVVPVAGNHELQHRAGGRVSVVENENAWRDNMGDLIVDSERFQRIVGQPARNINTRNHGEIDGLRSDQSQLSYSFDVADMHFVVINTDPVGADNLAPTLWLLSDMEAAAQRGAKHYFVFGHKPAFSYSYQKPAPEKAYITGLDKYPVQRDAFWNVIEKFHATYFCGHEHMFDMAQPRGAAWQVLVGTAGSPWDAKPGEMTLHPQSDRSFIWATVEVHRSGKVGITAHGFSDRYGATHVVRSVTLAR